MPDDEMKKPFPPSEDDREDEDEEVPMNKQMRSPDPMELVAQKLAEMSSVLKEIHSSLLSAEAVRKEKDGAEVVITDSPDVTDTEPKSGAMAGKNQTKPPTTTRGNEPLVKNKNNYEVLKSKLIQDIKKEMGVGSVKSVRPEIEKNEPFDEGKYDIRSFVKEALSGKKMTLKDIQEVSF